MTLSRSVYSKHAIRQHGIAAIEFGLVFILLLTVFYGIATFSAVFVVQQALHRAAEDGARASAQLDTAVVADDVRVAGIIHDSLANSLIVPFSQSSTFQSSRRWIIDHVAISVVPRQMPNDVTSAVVTIQYNYDSNALLPSLPFLDYKRWISRDLVARATATAPS